MPLEHAILAFLDLQPETGYDLKKNFDSSVRHFWSAAQSHIYKALESLEKKEFVASRIIPQAGKPNRKEFHITPAGRAELRDWIATPLPLSPVREAWMIQLFFAHPLSNAEIVQLIQARKEEIVQAIESLAEAQAAIEAQKQLDIPNVERMSALWQMTLDYGREFYQFELGWLEKAQQQAATLPPAELPG
jgi:PadR family transcriptional regulator AphA